MPKPKSKVPKRYFAAMSLLAIFTFPSLANALTINAQSTTKCDVFDCSTCVDLAQFGLNQQRIAKIKAMNFSTVLPKFDITNSNWSWSGNTICITGKIPYNTSNYWTMPIDTDVEIDPWWNSSWFGCKNLTITQYGKYDVAEVNITNITLNKSFEGRLLDNYCNNSGTNVNFTVLDYRLGNSTAWNSITFQTNGNTTYSYYYNNTAATDPGYYFLLFNPNLTAACDYTNDWYTGDTAKYACGGGTLNASAIDSSAYNTDQLQTKNSYLSYDKITFWNVPFLNATSGDQHYTRLFAATTTQGTWGDFYEVFHTITGNYRVYKTSPTVDTDTGIPFMYFKNYTNKVHYNPTDNKADYWLSNSTDNILYNLNSTSVPDVSYWGTWTDTSRKLMRFYQFRIYFGFVNPSLTHNPDVTVSGEVTNFAPVVPLNPVIDNTIICFKTKPVCIRLSDKTLTYRGYNYA